VEKSGQRKTEGKTVGKHIPTSNGNREGICMTTAKVGDVVEIVFLDHSEGPVEQAFCVYGRVSNRTKLVYVVDCWCPEDPAIDDELNTHRYSILRKTIKELYILKRSRK
jgi:hypothetical protein